jgi:uncharacterized protein (TIGR02594 family)
MRLVRGLGSIGSKRGVAILLCSAVLAVLAAPADARPLHRHHAAHAVAQPQTTGSVGDSRYPGLVAAQASEARGTRTGKAGRSHAGDAFGGITTNSLVSEARSYLGTNPTGRGSLWCGAFMDLVLKKTGHAGGGNLARGYARYGTRVDGPQVGAIAVMNHHVGVVSGIDPNGNPIIVSGNHNRTVAESVYPRGRISAYVMPGG